MVQSTSTPKPLPKPGSEVRATGRPATGEGAPSTDGGKISIAQNVVSKIAGVACREISGVHAMGTSSGRAIGAIRERVPGSSGAKVDRGISVEVGETQAAIDVDIVVEYGVLIASLGQSIQRHVKQAVENLTGLKVVEVNVNVDDVFLPSSDDEKASPSRVS